MKKSTIVASLLATLLICQIARADQFTLGAGVVVSPSAYKSYENTSTAIPVISYYSDDFFINSLSAGYYLIKEQNHRLDLNAFYSPLRYKPSDADDSAMRQLDRRHSTWMAGLTYRYIQDWGTLRTSVDGDILANSKGVIADFGYLYRYGNKEWSITPAVGVTWSNNKQNNYYYGISAKESARSGLAEYQASSSINGYVELSAHYNLTPSWNTFFNARVIALSDVIKDSPMIDKRYVTALVAGITYRF